MIAGLYPYVRGGVTCPPKITLSEIPLSININPSYRKDLFILAGDKESADHLKKFNLRAYRIFDDAPKYVTHDMAHKMKHWMCLWALREFGEFIWVDWDTVILQLPDNAFQTACRKYRTPKFIQIPNYWATVNCGVYYACHEWLQAMERSFDAKVDNPNDELLWASVLPTDVRERKEFWWNDHVVNIWNEHDFGSITDKTYFAHVKHLEWANILRSIQRKI